MVLGTSPPAAPQDERRAAITRSRINAYVARRDRFARERDALTYQWSRAGNLRLVVFLGAAACGVVTLAGGPPLLLLAGALLFGVYFGLARRQGRLARELARAAGLA